MALRSLAGQDSEVTTFTVQIRLRNDSDASRVLCIEPWLDERILAHGESVVVAFTSRLDGISEVCVEADRIEVSGWEGSTFGFAETALAAR